MSRLAEPIKNNLSLEEFLVFEETALEKHEFVHGEIFLMAGGTRKHNRIAVRIGTFLENQAEETSCLVAIADTLVFANGATYYPDVMLYCQEEDQKMVHRPCVIIEVLSKRTEDTDRGEKWLNYQTIESLQSYILLEQDPPRAEVFKRDENGWRYEKIEIAGILEIPCLKTKISLEQIYSRLG
jgi:Uma2 family endonuclease